ncbi:MAG: OmpA family protein [Thermodesulfobacteriota bacterium]|nr:OmpA family protein [Thermodesulfobacteriota bacterium]
MRTSFFNVLVFVCLIFGGTDLPAAADFYAFNEFLGLCPMSSTLTDVSKNGSYMAAVKNPRAFSKICPDVDKNTRVMIKRLDDVHWEAILRNNRVQFRCRDVGYSEKNGAGFVFARQCGTCPGGSAAAKAMNTTLPPEARADNTVIFDLNKAGVKPVFHPLLNDMAQQLKQDSDAVLEVRGHTCALGPELYNEKLSEKRANAVRRYLMEKGIDPNRIQTRAFGDSRPAASNSSPVGRTQNRRVEFQVKHSPAPSSRPASTI